MIAHCLLAAGALFSTPEVNELEEIWPQMLDAAAQTAIADGRHELAEYLRLKATNDAIRTAAVAWLIDAFIEAAGVAMGTRANLFVEREDPYTFTRGNSIMVGTLVEMKQGVRRLTLAAGWARHPSHGIMEKGALAFARFTHLGMPKSGNELHLVHGEDLPQWLDETDSPVDSGHIAHHISVFLS